MILRLVLDLGRLEHRAGTAGIGDDRHRVFGAERLDQHLHGIAAASGSLFGLVHRARGVDQEDEIGARLLLAVEREALDADMQERCRRFHGVGKTETVALNGSALSAGPA